jgi:hypothetical protein
MYAAPPSAVVPSRVCADKWLTNAMSVAAVGGNPAVALHTLCHKAYQELGIYSFLLQKSGRAIEVVVDDFVPVSAETGELLCAHSADPNELWVALCEKAYAKLHGGYDRLSRGSLAAGITDLVGGHCEKLTWTIASARGLIASGELFSVLQRRLFTQLKATIVATQPKADGRLKRDGLRASGLVPNAAYVVDNAVDLGVYQVVRLRHPGVFDDGTPVPAWRGKFGADSAELRQYSAALMWTDDQRRLATWMTVEDYATFFGNLYTVEHFNGSKDEQATLSRSFPVCWVDALNGGLMRDSALWTENPTVVLRVPQKNTGVKVVVTQPDQRLRAGAPLAYSNAIRLYVLAREVAGGAAGAAGSPVKLSSSPPPPPPLGLSSALGDVVTTRRRDWNVQSEVVFASPLCYGRELTCDVVMQSGWEYSLVAASSDRRGGARGRIKVVSMSRFTAGIVQDEDVHLSCASAWDTFHAGGLAFPTTINHQRLDMAPTALRNPQFLLHAKHDGQVVTVVLYQQPHVVSAAARAAGGGALVEAGASPPKMELIMPAQAAAAALPTVAAGALFYPAGFCVLKGSTTVQTLEALSSRMLAHTGALSALEGGGSSRVAMTMTLDAGTYVVVPSTQLAGQEAAFEVHAFSSQAMSLKGISL